MKPSLRTDPGKPYDVIVCGAGHAGCEAALAATRLGADVLLLTGNLDTIAQMSCNPAIGGQAKGQIVREIDALGGEMALIRILLQTIQTPQHLRGPSVQAPRAQCDKKAYGAHETRSRTKSAPLYFSIAGGWLILDGSKCIGVKTSLIFLSMAKVLL